MRSGMAALVLASVLGAPVGAGAAVIDFEGLSDLEALTSQYAGLTFAGATALVSGAIGGSLNEFDFPPRSGDVVVTDESGPFSITFDAPVGAVAGFFTYAAGLTIQAFDSSSVLIGSASSLFTNNTAGGLGDVGSGPNEFIEFAAAVGIKSVVFTGLAGGNSFVLDDLTITPLRDPDPDPDPVPEPATLSLLGLAGALAARRAQRSMLTNASNETVPARRAS
jgi:hypothetical protein